MQHNTLFSTTQALFDYIWRKRRVRPDTPPLVLSLATHHLGSSQQLSTLANHYVELLGAIDWTHFPHRDAAHLWPGPEPQSPVPYLIALLMRLDQKQHTMGQLSAFLHHHPDLAQLAGFGAPAQHGRCYPPVVPTPAQFSQFLRRLPNASLQFLLSQSVALLAAALPDSSTFGHTVCFDTKHIIAWVKENNSKSYIKEGRFDKTRQPAGDSDCRLGCKRRSNRAPTSSTVTPAAEGEPAERIGVGIGEFYWGYASGIVATRIPPWGEVVLAELTQTFDHSDVSYFFPLMTQVEQRLRRTPRFGVGDAAFDAFYIYEYFHAAGGMAAIPMGERNHHNAKTFSPDGVPLCAAGLPMVLKTTFLNRSSLIEHERQRWACPLLHPTPTRDACPVLDHRWATGGCLSTIAASIGARLRYQIDRTTEPYLSLYAQRTACERIFSQAVALGIERPKLRNAASVANLNTLTYVLINLRTLRRIKAAQTQMTHA